ncbi:MAG: hypothetical protein M1834_003765 [Cirrosporium novae-zelandiae]|nr:MAG: hypothetical protein M1834_003765 [Cirrosporium novae-zelandiae]
MPSVARSLVILAVVDGLVLKPSVQRNHQDSQGLTIQYKTRRISQTTQSLEETGPTCLEAHGIVGLFTAASSSFLISITSRQQIAQVQGKPIYVITGVAFIPLSSQNDAVTAIQQANQASQKNPKGQKPGEAVISSDSSDDEGRLYNGSGEESDGNASSILSEPLGTNEPKERGEGRSSVAEDVFQKRGLYGRFAERWFSRKGWSSEAMAGLGMRDPPANSALSQLPESKDNLGTSTAKEDKPAQIPQLVNTNNDESSDSGKSNLAENNIIQELLPKVLSRAKMLLTSGNFYFSYDHDITRRLAIQDSKPSDLPIYKRVDPLFFWNRWLASPFIEEEQHSFVLPIMQGFIGQKSFELMESQEMQGSATKNQEAEGITEATEAETIQESTLVQTSNVSKRSFLLTVISRRSVKRPGLRYLRRGVDEDGNTANHVETEQILSDPGWPPSKNIYSFVQVRGSIPLFFTQSPYTFKPLPLLQYSMQTNQNAFQKHFAHLKRRYGDIQIIQLLDKHGVEVGLGREYERHVQIYNDSEAANDDKLKFGWFDFHSETRGLKFENINKLVHEMEPEFDAFGYTVVNAGMPTKAQSGTFRTNCMDSLDRTGNVQSTFGQKALEMQLQEEGFTINIQTSIESTQWFNSLWADNGDAISRQYASTAALKGDFTRTRKRDYAGLLNDFSLTLSRYLHNTLSDYLTQATIDHLLNTIPSALAAFATSIAVSGPAPISLPSLRGSAIDACTSHVLPSQSDEELLDAWTALIPFTEQSLRAGPFKESVLLLSNKTLYVCRFDWNAEQVGRVQGIELSAITGVQWGAYITNTLDEIQADETRNVGLLIRYQRGIATHENTSSPSSDEDTVTKSDDPGASPRKGKSIISSILKTNLDTATITSTPAIFAAKVLPSSQSSSVGSQIPPSERDVVKMMCEEIARAANTARGSNALPIDSEDKKKGDGIQVEQKDIISLTEAQRQTGLLEKATFGLRKLVWS